MSGIFTISLDFELHWGVFDKKEREGMEGCYRTTWQLIPRMLELFSEYDVHVTWAAVGGLLANDQHEWEQWKPVIEPIYAMEKYSAYRWVQQNGLHAQYHWAHFAPEIIQSILKYPGQELGSHTFSHYYCLEQQCQPGAFEADLQAVRKAALKFNTQPVSLVFPRNQFNEDYLKICFENGIKVVRSNPAAWFWRPVSDAGASLIRKIVRTADAYIQLSNKRTSYPLDAVELKRGEPLQLPASRLLRPWQSTYRFANKLRLRRLCLEMRNAAVRNECYHLWWHPENFGNDPEENMQTLHTILQHYRKCNKVYGMKSWNMGEYAEHLLKGSHEEEKQMPQKKFYPV